MSRNSACRLDHLVVTAGSCEQGVAWFYELCGIHMPVGGEHPLMGTHNHVTALSTDQFLEIIAINPAAAASFDTAPSDSSTGVPAGVNARWFQLSDQKHLDKIEKRPELTTWVAATNNLDSALQRLKESGIDAGKPVKLTRDDLHWRLALKPDGMLAFDGIFPILIEWPDALNPVARMSDQSVRLRKLKATHPEHDRINVALESLGLSDVLNVENGPSKLSADLSVHQHAFSL